MFRIGVTTLIIIIAIGCGATLAEDDADSTTIPAVPLRTPIYKTDQPITIDGDLNDPAWRKAQAVGVDYVFGEIGRRDSHTPMTVWFTWDAHYFYIGYEVRDTDLVAINDGRVKGPPGNQRKAAQPWEPQSNVDIAEFIIHLGDGQFLWEFHHNALNDFNESFLVMLDKDSAMLRSGFSFMGFLYLDDMFVRDDGEFTVKTAVSMMPKADGAPSTPNDGSDTDTGYTGELRVPRRWLPPANDNLPGVAPPFVPDEESPPHEMSILSVVLNGNDGTVYHHSNPKQPNGMFAPGVATFPRYVLVDPDGADVEGDR